MENLKEEITREYLTKCALLCNVGGYYHLEMDKEQMKNSLLEKYVFDGNKQEILQQLQICEAETFSFIEEQKMRLFAWMDKYNEERLRNRINIALQSA
jgi:hypothetical protein